MIKKTQCSISLKYDVKTCIVFRVDLGYLTKKIENEAECNYMKIRRSRDLHNFLCCYLIYIGAIYFFIQVGCLV